MQMGKGDRKPVRWAKDRERKKQEREKSHQYHASQQLYEGRAPTRKQAKEPTCRFGHKGTGSESHTYSSNKG